MVTEVMAPVAVPVEPITPIRPSEAMRLGCLIAPVQAFGSYEVGDATCAIGAMAVGFGWDYRKAWSAESATDDFDCPVTGCDEGDSVIPHLNDDHRWARERIADWLAEQGL